MADGKLAEDWIDIGSTDELSKKSVSKVTAKTRELAVSFKNGTFGVVSNACNHVGGPLGEGRLDGDYINCPWHNWKFHRCTGLGEPGFEEDAVPAYPVKGEGGRVLGDLAAGTKRTRKPHDPDPLGRGVLALFQDGRTAQLRAERGDNSQSGSDPQQGRGLHHRRRPGQHPGRRGPNARLLR